MGKRIAIALISISALLAALLGAVFVFSQQPESLSASRPQVQVKIRDVFFDAEVAADPAARQKGLSGRPSIPAESGMVFFFDVPGRPGIWMKGMQFPLDIFWIRDGKIIDVRAGAPPVARAIPDAQIPVYYPIADADLVFEAAAGTAARYGIRAGDALEVFRNGGRVYPAENAVHQEELVPGKEFFIETLRKNPPIGRGFRIEKLIFENQAYKKYLIFYRFDDLGLSGVMNVPNGDPPAGGWPVIILNHGLIHPSVYYSGRGSRREQDFFTRNGYVTIHPDYRGLGSSDPNPSSRHDFYVGYTLDVLGLIDALKEAHPNFIDTERIGMWGHSMGGGIAGRVMVLRPDIKAFALFAPISADVEDNFYELKSEEVEWLHHTYGEASSTAYRAMSPIDYFGDVSAPVQLHHGTADTAVSIGFSEKMFAALNRSGKTAEFFRYLGEPHEFAGDWQLAADRTLEFFDRYVKNASN